MDKKRKVGIGLGIALVALILGYFGFMFFISTPSNKTDLGITYTDHNFDSAVGKIGLEINVGPPNVPPEESIVITRPKEVNTTLTSEELTALINELGKRWNYFPLNKTQIRINNEGSVEVSGILLRSRLEGFAKALNLPDQVVTDLNTYTSMISVDPVYYMKFTLSVHNYGVQSNLIEMRVGNIVVPQELLASVQTTFHEYMYDTLERPPLVNIKNMSFHDGVLSVEGVIPSEISLSPPGS